MRIVTPLLFLFLLPCYAADPRDIRTGTTLPSEGYCDQPYVIVMDDGTWLCVMTTGRGHEGDRGQHIVATTSADKGKTWSSLIDIEPATGPEASWVMPLRAGKRIYVFYTYNADDMRQVKTSKGQLIKRVDTLGKYAYKFSDDGGRTWSAQRQYLPMRTTEIDRGNVYQGKVHFFWGVGKPIADRGQVFLGASKVGNFGTGFMESSEGIVFRSDNILTEPDPAKHHWVMLPDGDIGLRAPAGSVCDEHTVLALNDGSLFCIARTTQGSPTHYYSTDRGHTWTKPDYAIYAPGGRRIRQPRANTHIWKTSAGKYLLWFHNHGGKTYDDRNPAWLSGGIEKDGKIHWSQPEILLYDANPKTRMSYPDLIEQDGRFWITETQKTIARVHAIDPALLNGLWEQHTNRTVCRTGLALELDRKHLVEGEAEMPKLPSLSSGGGFSIDLRLMLTDFSSDQVILDTRDPAGKGLAVVATKAATIRIDLCDGVTKASWDCDAGLLKTDATHDVTVIVDGGPKIVTFIVDGQLCDGGGQRQFGWSRFDPKLDDVNARKLRLAPDLKGILHRLRLYDRHLRTSEAIGNHRADTATSF